MRLICTVKTVCLNTCGHTWRFLCGPAGGEASGPGQTGDTQHSQEADRLPAGSAGDRCGEEIGQVTLGERHHPSLSNARR